MKRSRTPEPPPDPLLQQLARDINARWDPLADASVSTETEALYGEVDRGALETLRLAFTLDRDRRGSSPLTRAFCQSRIDLITRILDTRAPLSITCPFCYRVSYNPGDVANRYCGSCHRFHDDPAPEAIP